MSKAFTEVDLATQLATDRTWRLKEISDLKAAIVRADSQLQQVLMRSLITICYAHWEGFIRFASRKYLEHISLRKHPYDKLNSQFLKNYISPKLSSIAKANANFLEKCVFIDEILSCGSRRFTYVDEDLINTRSNLNYNVLSEICTVCGVDPKLFEAENVFIDITLLKRRNSIAHGEDTLVAVDDIDEIANKTISLMRLYGDSLENQAYLRSYMAA